MADPVTLTPLPSTDTPQIAGFPAPVWTDAPFGLPYSVDQAEQIYGPDIYDRMLRNPIVQGVVNGLVCSICDAEPSMAPVIPVPKASAPSALVRIYDASAKIGDMVTWCLGQIGQESMDMEAVYYEMVRTMLTHGHKLAEASFRLCDQGQYRGKLMWDAVSTKPRENYAFICDQGYRVYGVIAKMPGVSLNVRSGMIPNATLLPNTVDRSRLWWCSFWGQNGDPRGTSLLRGAYTPWRKLEHGDPEEVRTCIQFGGGMIVFEADKEASATIKGENGQDVPAFKALEPIGRSLRNGAFASLPPGYRANRLSPPATDFFDGYVRRATEQITMAMATNIRAFLEAKHSSKADSEGGQDQLATFVRRIRRSFALSMRERLVRRLVALNYGPRAAALLCPQVTVQETSTPDYGQLATAFAALVSSQAITPEMRPQIAEQWFGFEWLGDTDGDGDKGDEADERAGDDRKAGDKEDALAALAHVADKVLSQ